MEKVKRGEPVRSTAEETTGPFGLTPPRDVPDSRLLTVGLSLIGLASAALVATLAFAYEGRLAAIATMALLVLAVAALWTRRVFAQRARNEIARDLLASRQRFALVMQATNEGYWEWDPQADYAYMSGRSRGILGYKPGDIERSFAGFERMLHPDDRAAVLSAIQGYLSGATSSFSIHVRLQHKDGHYVPVLAKGAIARTPDGRPSQFAGTILDLSELERIGIQLHDAEQRYHDIVERSPRGIYQTLPDGRVLTANSACAKLLGYDSPEEFLAVDVASAVYVDPHCRTEWMERLLKHGTIAGFETRMRRKDGSIIWTSNTARAVRDEAGALRYFEGSIEDVTARREAEQTKAEFISLATHQLRTPLTAIKWLLELAATADVPPETASFIADARASADRLIDLVNSLLNVGRLESGRVVTNAEPLDLAAVTLRVVDELNPLITEKHLAIALPSGGGVSHAMMDPKLCTEVVMNLLSNAVRYTPYGGSVTIQIRGDGDLVEWAVRDTGIGIPQSVQRRIFEKFFRAENAIISHTEGTGLGLYFARLIVERSGGRMWFESAERAGSTFHFTVPAAVESGASTTAAPVPEALQTAEA